MTIEQANQLKYIYDNISNTLPDGSIIIDKKISYVKSFSSVGSINFAAEIGKTYIIVANSIASDASLTNISGGEILTQTGFNYQPSGGWPGTAHISCIMATSTTITINYNIDFHDIILYELKSSESLRATVVGIVESSSITNFDCNIGHLYIIGLFNMGGYVTITDISGGVLLTMKNISYQPSGGWVSGAIIMAIYATSNNISLSKSGTAFRVPIIDIY